MALNAQQKETKNLATALLEADGKDYDQALDEFHQDIISKNKDTIMKGLKALKKMNKNDGKEERGKASETEKNIQHQQ
ncbi:hypothetical protein LIZ91_06400 [Enterococcus avium]|uniref:hypothetical protein n=1 Tax=Enterococcus avium TaxID=33945 RepID=UPI001D070FFA|nr:hypothetical protein [Enterococcus avium]MCB6916214.1 hypothetical protein [Enterococcus avium]MCQ4960070.1 hypothetical protein [Enterococcus avium]